MEQTLAGRTIALLVTEGFDEAEMCAPKEALERAGAMTVLVSDSRGIVVHATPAPDSGAEGSGYAVDQPVTNARAEEYDALVIPSGAHREEAPGAADALRLIAEFVQESKPVAALGSGADLIRRAGADGAACLRILPAGASAADRDAFALSLIDAINACDAPRAGEEPSRAAAAAGT